MKRAFFLSAMVLLCCGGAAQAGIMFEADLKGSNERPTPNASPATGHATGELTGGLGSYVFTYSIDYSGLTGLSVSGAHIHLSSPGIDPVNEAGGVKHPLDGNPVFTHPGGTINGDWRFDDSTNKLTDVLAADLLAGKMYVNVHTNVLPGGEIRGQLVVVPEPASLGLLGLIGVGLLARRRRN